MALLSCRDLCLGYDGREILHNLNFQVNAGDYLCIVGENGSGKTTLMRAILGLTPALSGQILMENGHAAAGIGYLPQQTAVQKDFPATVREIVLSGCQGQCGLRPFYTKAERSLAATNMKKMNVADLAGRSFRELSGGQQQRVLLARALCAAENMLLLDEPVTALDPNAAEEMYRLTAELNRREKTTVIMITHDMGAALRFATHILHLGNSVFFGTREEYEEKMSAGGFSAAEGGEPARGTF